jgi:hypothetical protein
VDAHACRERARAQFLGEARLADPRLARNQDQRATIVARVLEIAEQSLQLDVASDELAGEGVHRSQCAVSPRNRQNHRLAVSTRAMFEASIRAAVDRDE